MILLTLAIAVAAGVFAGVALLLAARRGGRRADQFLLHAGEDARPGHTPWMTPE
jgi:hypothetical protein